MIIEEENYLVHYGILRKSGRYPWGSGKTQDERNRSFLGEVDELRRKGLSETEIAKGFKISTTELRAAKSIAKSEQRQAEIAMARRLKDKGYSNTAIAARMGKNESSIRALLDPGLKDRNDVLKATSDMLRSQVSDKRYIDIGSGVEHHVGVSKEKLAAAVAVLKEQDYTVHYLKVEQLGTGKQTTIKVLAAPGTSYAEVFSNRDKIQQIRNFSNDGGRSYLGLHKPLAVDPSRVAVRYAEHGGTDADGVIYVRPGVKDLSLGGSKYAQVRIQVGDSHYLKGMAMYKPDLPVGVDLVFNTNKSDTGTKTDAMKKLKDDPDNPFGAVVRQLVSRDSHGKPVVTSAMNLVNEEGNWGEWARSLSSQMLSKQSPSLARTQLQLMAQRKQTEYDEIMALTNPAVKRKLLDSFADDVDAAAVHLKAAALPRQASHVILPVNSLKHDEIYAPNYRDGERVSLIRYPHGGIFEIPTLTVNNRHQEARKLLGNAPDAVGIHSKVAERLSGADFDGDTVLVIPNNNRTIKTAPALEGLKNFDPQRAYPGYEGMPKMSSRTKAIQMGVVSNLITDMTIRGANPSELARAVRHSMVVIDAEKHNLNYRQSAIDNGIPQLKTKYQGGPTSGASTLISRASSEVRVPIRKERPASMGGSVDKTTGAKRFINTGESYTDRSGKVVLKTTKSTRLAETADANTLSSGTVIEKVYADHSNTLKALANKARLSSVNTKSIPYSPSAREVYSSEVSSLNSKLTIALKNSPLERQAQLIANSIVSQKRAANPDLDASEIKKLKAQALAEARARTGAKKQQIIVEPNEWEAIQAGAISNNKLTQILNNADLDVIKRLSTPKTERKATAAMVSRVKKLLASGHTQAEVADALGISVTEVKTLAG